MEPIAAGNASLAQASADGACQQLGGDSETRHLLHASACLSHSPAEEAEQEDTAAALRPGQPPAPSTTDQGHAGCIGPVAATRSFSSSSHHSMMVERSPRVPPGQLLLSAEKAVSMRLLPPLLLLVIISYLDRTALSFASIQMSQDLNLSSSMYGLGSGEHTSATQAHSLHWRACDSRHNALRKCRGLLVPVYASHWLPLLWTWLYE
jgi:hypothetical protein